MFYYLNGTITLLDANLAVVDCGGVGYACHTTNYTLARLQLGKPAKLFTYCNIKEDAFDIFGFSTREELNCFERLLGVTGVGPKAALAILSVVSPEQLTLAVMTQDDKTITMAQGVGKKLGPAHHSGTQGQARCKPAGAEHGGIRRLRRAGARQQVRGGDRRARRPRLFADGGGGGAQGH